MCKKAINKANAISFVSIFGNLLNLLNPEMKFLIEKQMAEDLLLSKGGAIDDREAGLAVRNWMSDIGRDLTSKEKLILQSVFPEIVDADIHKSDVMVPDYDEIERLVEQSELIASWTIRYLQCIPVEILGDKLDYAQALYEQKYSTFQKQTGTEMQGLKGIVDVLFDGLTTDNGSVPTEMDLLKNLFESQLAGIIPADQQLEMHEVPSKNDCVFVIAPQRTVIDREWIMSSGILYRDFLASRAARELLEMYRSGAPMDLIMPVWVEDHRSEIMPLMRMLRTLEGTSAEILANLPPDEIEEYQNYTEEYPGLNILPRMVFFLLGSVNSRNHPDGYVAEDVRQIAIKAREKGMNLKIVDIREKGFKWPRDIISWVDDKHYVTSSMSVPGETLAEGGMVVNGKGKGDFILVSCKTPVEQTQWLEKQIPGLDVSRVHPGFLTILHSEIHFWIYLFLL